MSSDEKKFRWRDLGDLVAGRPNLGGHLRLEMYRLLEFSLREVMEREVGQEKTDLIFREAGHLAGGAFRRHFLPPTEDLEEYMRELKDTLRTMGAGILRVEEADPERGSFVLTVSEDMDCSGIGGDESDACVYGEGFVAAVIEGFTGKPYRVREVECWRKGDRTCRFVAEAEGEGTA
jgi:predicted hydrocarbon binding protein